MKKFLLVPCILLLSGCFEGFNEYECLKSVKKEFPGADVRPIPNMTFKFIVKTATNEIYYVETMNSDDTKITKEVRMF